jgi:hypothetical protein
LKELAINFIVWWLDGSVWSEKATCHRGRLEFD